MNPDFSEFSYGFALTREVCERNWGGFDTAPVFPSLVEEGRQGGGYDVTLDLPGNPLFLQFKTSEWMVRSTAKEWDLFGGRYYRFLLHAARHSDQHRLLLGHDRDPTVVYYAAPAIHTVGALNDAFVDGDVIEHSVFLRPRDIGPLPDLDAHCIAFQPGRGHGYFCSEPREILVEATGSAVFDKLTQRLRDLVPIEPSDRYFAALAEELTMLTKERVGMRPAEVALRQVEAAPRVRAAYLTRTILGAELLWVTQQRRG